MSNTGYRVTLKNVEAVVRANELIDPSILEDEGIEQVSLAIFEHMGLDVTLIEKAALPVGSPLLDDGTLRANEELARQLRERGVLEPIPPRDFTDPKAWREYLNSPECVKHEQACKDLEVALEGHPIKVSKRLAPNGETYFRVYDSASEVTRDFLYEDTLEMSRQYEAALKAASKLARSVDSDVIDNTATLIVLDPKNNFGPIDALVDPAYRAQIQGLHDMTAALEGRPTPEQPVVFSIDVIVTDHWLNGEDSFIRVYDPSSPSTHVFPYEDSAQRVDQIRNALEVASAQAAKHGALVSDQTENRVQPLHEPQPTESNDSPQG